jgi:hypothetical protein
MEETFCISNLRIGGAFMMALASNNAPYLALLKGELALATTFAAIPVGASTEITCNIRNVAS